MGDDLEVEEGEEEEELAEAWLCGLQVVVEEDGV